MEGRSEENGRQRPQDLEQELRDNAEQLRRASAPQSGVGIAETAFGPLAVPAPAQAARPGSSSAGARTGGGTPQEPSASGHPPRSSIPVRSTAGTGRLIITPGQPSAFRQPLRKGSSGEARPCHRVIQDIGYWVVSCSNTSRRNRPEPLARRLRLSNSYLHA